MQISFLAALLSLTSPLPQGTPPTQARWQSLPDYPHPIANNSVTSVRHRDGTSTVFSFMGIQDPSDASSITSNSYRLDLPGGTWQAIADPPLYHGLPRVASSAITIAGEVYLLGGYTVDPATFGELSDPRLFRYEPDTDTYIRLAGILYGIDDTVVGVYRDRYLFTASGWPVGTRTQVYDTFSNTWQLATPSFGAGRFGHVGGLIGDKLIYMDGAGSAFRSDPQVLVGTIDPLGTGEVTNVAWTEVAAHPGATTYRAAGSQEATSDGRLLIVGGGDNTYNWNGVGYSLPSPNALEQIMLYEPASDTWEVVTASGSHVPTMDHRSLGRVGPNTWAIVGGMTAPLIATRKCYALRIGPRVRWVSGPPPSVDGPAPPSPAQSSTSRSSQTRWW